MDLPVCSYCGFPIPKRHPWRCPCSAVTYCDRVCQQRDWYLSHNLGCPFRGLSLIIRRVLAALPPGAEALVKEFLRNCKWRMLYSISRVERSALSPAHGILKRTPSNRRLVAAQTSGQTIGA